MKHRLLSCILLCLPTPVVTLAKEHPSIMTSQHQNLTPDQAIVAVRSKAPKSGTSFQIIREIRSNAKTQDVAQRSLQEAASRHVQLFDDGIFVNVLQSGGFLILEIDPTTSTAVALHLVSKGTDERPVIDSYQIEGRLSSAVAAELIQSTAHFADALLSTPPSAATVLESRFCSGRFPEYDKPEEESFFAIPRGIRKIEADESEYSQLAALLGAFEFWPIRYALSMPIYPANPSSAVESAREKHQALIEEFMRKNNKSAGFIRSSINDPQQLRERIFWLRQLDEFLEQAFKWEVGSPAFEVNKSISTVALQLGSVGNGKQDSFLAVTSPGLIVEWVRAGEGRWAVTKISLAEGSDSGKGEAESRIQTPPR